MLMRADSTATAPGGQPQYGGGHFRAEEVFEGVSYAQRYMISYERMIGEKIYDATALMLSEEDAARTGVHRSLSRATSTRTFFREFGAHIRLSCE